MMTGQINSQQPFCTAPALAKSYPGYPDKFQGTILVTKLVDPLDYLQGSVRFTKYYAPNMSHGREPAFHISTIKGKV